MKIDDLGVPLWLWKPPHGYCGSKNTIEHPFFEMVHRCLYHLLLVMTGGWFIVVLTTTSWGTLRKYGQTPYKWRRCHGKSCVCFFVICPWPCLSPKCVEDTLRVSHVFEAAEMNINMTHRIHVWYPCMYGIQWWSVIGYPMSHDGSMVDWC